MHHHVCTATASVPLRCDCDCDVLEHDRGTEKVNTSDEPNESDLSDARDEQDFVAMPQDVDAAAVHTDFTRQ